MKQVFRLPPFKVDRSLRTGLAVQLANALRNAIATGYYEAGDVLPPIRDMSKLTGVSSVLVSRAIRILKEERLVSPRPHNGCVVCAKDRPLWKGQVLIAMPPGGTQHYMNVVCTEVHDALIAAGYLALTVTVPKNAAGKYDFALLDLMMRQQTDLVVQLYDLPEITKRLSSRKVSFVRMTTDVGRHPSGCVGTVRRNFETAAMEFTAHCRSVGVREVLLVSAWGSGMRMSKALREAGVNVTVHRLGVPSGTPGPQVSQFALEAMTAWLRENRQLPELVYFDDDYVASGAITALLCAGIRIPDDIHVTALANRSSGGGLAFPVPFTRMEVDSIADGRTVASAVIEYLKTGAFPSGVTVGPKYVRGKTF